MNGYVFNTRRPLFADPRVREALGLVFDFGWVNRNLFFGVLRRSDSYFSDSDLSSHGRPADERERRLLAAFPGAVREDILVGTWSPAESDGSGRDRDLARRALALLREAGYSLEEGRLRRQDTGEPFTFEILVNSRQQERLALNYAQSLERLGIAAQVRLRDDAQYWRRLSRFEFDMVQWAWPASLSPGSEQRGRWGAAAAERQGSLNFAGVRSPAADAMIDALLSAERREDFAAAARALDRVLLSGFYVVPLFYIGEQWLAYDAGLRRPERLPLLGTTTDVWWRDRPQAMIQGGQTPDSPSGGSR
jgi:peptide/nickel transport system substrate-binding protein